MNVKTLDTTRSIFEAKRTKTRRAKFALVRIRDNIFLLNRELRRVASVFLD